MYDFKTIILTKVGEESDNIMFSTKTVVLIGNINQVCKIQCEYNKFHFLTDELLRKQ